MPSVSQLDMEQPEIGRRAKSTKMPRRPLLAEGFIPTWYQWHLCHAYTRRKFDGINTLHSSLAPVMW